jgi:hypothetical protein
LAKLDLDVLDVVFPLAGGSELIQNAEGVLMEGKRISCSYEPLYCKGSTLH